MKEIAEFHPITVHFPIVLLITYVVFENLGVWLKKESLSETALYFLIAGILSTIFALLTGNQAAEVAIQLAEKGANIPQELIEEHETFATITMWFYLALGIARIYFVIKKKLTDKLKIIIAILGIIGILFIYETGEHGGKLVYKFGVGTELIEK
ncbi:MAG: DUF2231 domain-containing protein [Melioribacteraceae bacterium]|nr:DUF2231 domain-containing protein [Melioribacteraceae bacterium]MCF8412761.1 DUF2231 domain-containing protein [Melioribacteraceae bacterium]